MAQLKHRTGPVCSVYYCDNRESDKPSKSFFRFPKDHEICAKWVHLCRCSDLDSVLKSSGSEKMNRTHFICSDHFTTNDFMNPNKKSSGLIKGRVPSLNLQPTSEKKQPNPKKRKRSPSPKGLEKSPERPIPASPNCVHQLQYLHKPNLEIGFMPRLVAYSALGGEASNITDTPSQYVATTQLFTPLPSRNSTSNRKTPKVASASDAIDELILRELATKPQELDDCDHFGKLVALSLKKIKSYKKRKLVEIKIQQFLYEEMTDSE